MADFAALPLFTDAFISDTLHLTAEETGAYLMLLMVAWRSQNCDLPCDDKKLAKYARCTPARWRKIRGNIIPFFDQNERGCFEQKRLTKERLYVENRRDIKRVNGTKGGRPKSLKNKEPEKPIGSVSVNLNETYSKAPTPTPTPIKEKKVAKAPQKKGTRLSETWVLSPEEKSFAAAQGLTPQEIFNEADKFRDYWTALSGQRATKRDWTATWRNWIRNRRSAPGQGQRRDTASEFAEAVNELKARCRSDSDPSEDLGSDPGFDDGRIIDLEAIGGGRGQPRAPAHPGGGRNHGREAYGSVPGTGFSQRESFHDGTGQRVRAVSSGGLFDSD